jgi:hypothetical protein
LLVRDALVRCVMSELSGRDGFGNRVVGESSDGLSVSVARRFFGSEPSGFSKIVAVVSAGRGGPQFEVHLDDQCAPTSVAIAVVGRGPWESRTVSRTEALQAAGEVLGSAQTRARVARSLPVV